MTLSRRLYLRRVVTLAAACGLVTLPLVGVAAAAGPPGTAPTTATSPTWSQPVLLGTTPKGTTDPEVQAGEVIGPDGLIHVEASGTATVSAGTVTYGAVYRSTDRGSWRFQGTASTNPDSGFGYFDQDVAPGHTYRYAIEAIASDGSTSWGYSHVMRFGIIDDQSHSLVYHGKWRVRNQANAYGKTVHQTNSPGASVSLTKKYTLLDYVVTVPPAAGPRGCFTISDSVSGDIDSQCYQNMTSVPVYRAFADYVAGGDTVASTATVTRQYKYPINLDAFVIVNDLG